MNDKYTEDKEVLMHGHRGFFFWTMKPGQMPGLSLCTGKFLFLFLEGCGKNEKNFSQVAAFGGGLVYADYDHGGGRGGQVLRCGYDLDTAGGYPGLLHAAGVCDGGDRAHESEECRQHRHEEFHGLCAGHHRFLDLGLRAHVRHRYRRYHRYAGFLRHSL